jgi:hypothetical protein
MFFRDEHSSLLLTVKEIKAFSFEDGSIDKLVRSINNKKSELTTKQASF